MNHVTWDSLVADVCFISSNLFWNLATSLKMFGARAPTALPSVFGDTDSAARLLGHEELESHQVRPLNHPEHAQAETNQNLKY